MGITVWCFKKKKQIMIYTTAKNTSLSILPWVMKNITESFPSSAETKNLLWVPKINFLQRLASNPWPHNHETTMLTISFVLCHGVKCHSKFYFSELSLFCFFYDKVPKNLKVVKRSSFIKRPNQFLILVLFCIHIGNFEEISKPEKN